MTTGAFQRDPARSPRRLLWAAAPPSTRLGVSHATLGMNLIVTQRPSLASLASRRLTAPMNKRVNFAAVNEVALRALPLILARWLPDGKRLGREFVARNPTRADRTAGSFRI